MASLPRIELQLPSDEAFKRLIIAGDKVGKVEEVSEIARYVVIKARYGLEPVRVRASVTTASETTSFLEIQGRGQDVWGVGSRKVMERIVQAIIS